MLERIIVQKGRRAGVSREIHGLNNIPEEGKPKEIVYKGGIASRMFVLVKGEQTDANKASWKETMANEFNASHQ